MAAYDPFQAYQYAAQRLAQLERERAQLRTGGHEHTLAVARSAAAVLDVAIGQTRAALARFERERQVAARARLAVVREAATWWQPGGRSAVVVKCSALFPRNRAGRSCHRVAGFQIRQRCRIWAREQRCISRCNREPMGCCNIRCIRCNGRAGLARQLPDIFLNHHRYVMFLAL